ncbi:hypothetical protein [Sphingobacterium faecium]|uniref:hypothetical protein n=1 Tax=Sphingobacterium faecium TaxID=34087 RepID=UPI00320BA25F
MKSSHKLKTILCVSAIALTSFQFTACKKDKVEEPKEEEVFKTEGLNVAVPSGKTIFYDLKKQEDATESSYTFKLSGMYGSRLDLGNQGYQMGYFDLKNTSIKDIKLTNTADFNQLDVKETNFLTVDASTAGEPANGPTWIIYDYKNNHAVYPTADRYIVFYKKADITSGAQTEVIIMQADKVTAKDGNARYQLKSESHDINILKEKEVKTGTVAAASGKTVFYDLLNDKITETAETSLVNLSGMYGSTLKPSMTAYKFGYFDLKGKTIEDIKIANLKELDFKEATSLGIDASSAGQPAIGPTWIIYDFKNNHAVYPTADRFVLLYKGTSLSENANEVIIFKAESVVALNGDATYTLKIKQFIK